MVHSVLSTELNTIFAMHMPMKFSTMVGFSVAALKSSNNTCSAAFTPSLGSSA